MRRALLASLALLLAIPALAYQGGALSPHSHSGSSSGGSLTNLSLGGYLDVTSYVNAQASMTVLGNAFSVGTDSFTVVGSSIGIRTASPEAALHVVGDSTTTGTAFAGSLQVNDLVSCDSIGTDSSGAASCGTSSAVLSSTQTFSGENTFTSTTTFSATNKTCPPGFTNIENTTLNVSLGCMQTAKQGTATWQAATDDCFTTFCGRLPSDSELYIAVNNFVLTDETNTDQWLDQGTAITGVTDKMFRVSGSITDVNTKNGVTATPYRCWIPK